MQTIILDQYFLAKYAVGQISPKQVVDFAHQSMMDGIYSDSLLDIIDMEPPNSVSVFDPFELYLAKNQIKTPSVQEATQFFLRFHIKKMASGEFNPYSRCKKLLADIEYVSLHEGITKYAGDNLGIEFIYAWYYEDYESMEDINKNLKIESQKWLEKQSLC